MTITQRRKYQNTRLFFQSLLRLTIISFLVYNMTACSDKTDDIIDDDDKETVIENPNTDTFVYNQNVSTPNILLIIADDMGMDATPYATQLNTQKPTMPNLTKLQENGVRFTNTWAYPRCTPTRGTIMTGKHGVTTGLLAPGDDIGTNQTILQNYINSSYANALLGKWHLSERHNRTVTSSNIENLGIEFYKGNTGGGVGDSYYDWKLHEDGAITEIKDTYSTTAYTNYAIDWIKEQSKPWFCWVAYNAAHSPFHTPKDASLYTHQGSSELDQYLQMVEAMDSEIGRLLENIPPDELANTTIIFIGDNGTPGQVAQAPFTTGRAKGSLYNGGINVPLVVSGANVSRTNVSDNALIQSTDLYATIADISGVNNPNIHESISFKNLLTNTAKHTRNYNFSEGTSNGPAFGGYTIRNEKYKLTYNEDAKTYFLFDVINDYEESKNLYDGDLTNEEQTVFDALKAEYNRIHS